MPIQHPGLKLALLVALCGVPLFGALSMWWQGVSPIPALAYPLFSVLALLFYQHDKHQASRNGQRTPEKLLHALELAGGWPGALLAQQLFRHKTRKLSYQALFWLIVAVHQVFWIDRLFVGSALARLL